MIRYNTKKLLKKVNIKHKLDLFPNITDVAGGIGSRRDNPQDDVSLTKQARDEDESSENSNGASSKKSTLSKKNIDKIGLLLCHSHIELRLWLRLS